MDLNLTSSKINLVKILIGIILISIIISSCTDKFDIEEATSSISSGSTDNIGDTVYIQQSPDWTGFNKPKDMIYGKDQFLYVADTDNDRIVMLNIAGQVLGEKSIKNPIAIAQNFKLELFVVAEFDTVLNDQNLTFSAIYRIDLVGTGHILNNAKIERLLPQDQNIDPFAFNRTDRFYTGICTFYDNTVFVSRTGPSNSNPVDRDNSILKLSFPQSGSISISRIPGLEPEGTGILSANKISSLTSFTTRSTDIILTLIGDNSFKVQWLEFLRTADFEGYRTKLGAFSSDLMTVNKFGLPQGTTLDDANNIYVADSEKDSVFKFNTFGDELESFGGTEIMSSPHAVAYHDRTLYVLDTDNNRILRFILSTEVN
jgi:DNA-binding beta-propeller fold protein YncE